MYVFFNLFCGYSFVWRPLGISFKSDGFICDVLGAIKTFEKKSPTPGATFANARMGINISCGRGQLVQEVWEEPEAEQYEDSDSM